MEIFLDTPGSTCCGQKSDSFVTLQIVLSGSVFSHSQLFAEYHPHSGANYASLCWRLMYLRKTCCELMFSCLFWPITCSLPSLGILGWLGKWWEVGLLSSLWSYSVTNAQRLVQSLRPRVHMHLEHQASQLEQHLGSFVAVPPLVFFRNSSTPSRRFLCPLKLALWKRGGRSIDSPHKPVRVQRHPHPTTPSMLTLGSAPPIILDVTRLCLLVGGPGYRWMLQIKHFNISLPVHHLVSRKSKSQIVWLGLAATLAKITCTPSGACSAICDNCTQKFVISFPVRKGKRETKRVCMWCVFVCLPPRFGDLFQIFFCVMCLKSAERQNYFCKQSCTAFC